MNRVILGIDPGTRKTGYAAIDGEGRVMAQGIEPPETLVERLTNLTSGNMFEAIALGRGTNAKSVRLDLTKLGVPIVLVDEHETTLQARALYFADHPPRGWRRWIPLGMQLPPVPIDDYAAILIARRYLREVRGCEGPTGPAS